MTASFKTQLVREVLDKTTLTNCAVRAMENTAPIYRPTSVSVVDITNLEAIIQVKFSSGTSRYYKVRVSEVTV